MAGWPFDLFGMGGQEEEEAEELRVLNVPRPIGRISRSWGHELRAKALVALLLDDRQQAICAVEGVDDSFMRDSMTWCLTADDMEVCYAALGLGELAAAAGETSTSVPRAFLLGAPKAFSALLGYVQHEMLVAPSTGVSDRFGFSSGAAGFERWSDRAFNHGGFHAAPRSSVVPRVDQAGPACHLASACQVDSMRHDSAGVQRASRHPSASAHLAQGLCAEPLCGGGSAHGAREARARVFWLRRLPVPVPVLQQDAQRGPRCAGCVRTRHLHASVLQRGMQGGALGCCSPVRLQRRYLC